MRLGLDNFVLLPPASLFASIIMLTGLFYIGKNLILKLNLTKIINNVSISNSQNILISLIFSSIILYPIVLYEFYTITLLKVYALIIFFSGLICLIKFLYFCSNNIINLNRKSKLKLYLFFFLFLGFFFLACGPITDSDSLDYHVSIPIYIINFGKFPSEDFWFHAVKAGSGEVINTLGLILGAESFSSLIQFGGIISISGLILKSCRKKNSIKYLIYIAVISSPVLLFFVSSSKPQLIYIAGNSLAFCLIFFFQKKINSKDLLKSSFLVSVLLFVSITDKFSFSLVSFLLFISLIYIMFVNKLLIKFLTTTTFAFLIILAPLFFWRWSHYHGDFFFSFFPIPLHIYGYQQLQNSLTTCGYHGCFPYWLLFPKSPGEFTEFFGYGYLLLFLFKDYGNKKLLIILILIIINSFLTHIFGPNVPRYHMESLIWTGITATRFPLRFSSVKFLFFKNIIFIQAVIFFFVLWYGAFSISIGSLSKDLRSDIMNSKANGYSLLKWASKNLPEDSLVISTHRSISLIEKRVISGDFINYIDLRDSRSLYYLNQIKSLKPTHIIFYDKKKDFKYFYKCINKLEYYKKDVGSNVSRNPFRKGSSYDGYIYSLNSLKMPECILNNKQ